MLTFNIIAPTLADAQAHQTALVTLSGAEFYASLAPAIEALAKAQGIHPRNVTGKLGAVSIVSLLYTHDYWALLLSFLLRNAMNIVGICGGLIACLICITCGRRINDRARALARKQRIRAAELTRVKVARDLRMRMRRARVRVKLRLLGMSVLRLGQGKMMVTGDETLDAIRAAEEAAKARANAEMGDEEAASFVEEEEGEEEDSYPALGDSDEGSEGSGSDAGEEEEEEGDENEEEEEGEDETGDEDDDGSDDGDDDDIDDEDDDEGDNGEDGGAVATPSPPVATPVPASPEEGESALVAINPAADVATVDGEGVSVDGEGESVEGEGGSQEEGQSEVEEESQEEGQSDDSAPVVVDVVLSTPPAPAPPMEQPLTTPTTPAPAPSARSSSLAARRRLVPTPQPAAAKKQSPPPRWTSFVRSTPQPARALPTMTSAAASARRAAEKAAATLAAARAAMAAAVAAADADAHGDPDPAESSRAHSSNSVSQDELNTLHAAAPSAQTIVEVDPSSVGAILRAAAAAAAAAAKGDVGVVASVFPRSDEGEAGKLPSPTRSYSPRLLVVPQKGFRTPRSVRALGAGENATQPPPPTVDSNIRKHHNSINSGGSGSVPLDTTPVYTVAAAGVGTQILPPVTMLTDVGVDVDIDDGRAALTARISDAIDSYRAAAERVFLPGAIVRTTPSDEEDDAGWLGSARGGLMPGATAAAASLPSFVPSPEKPALLHRTLKRLRRPVVVTLAPPPPLRSVMPQSVLQRSAASLLAESARGEEEGGGGDRGDKAPVAIDPTPRVVHPLKPSMRSAARSAAATLLGTRAPQRSASVPSIGDKGDASSRG